MEWATQLVRIASNIALALCTLGAAFWVFFVFIFPDVTCFKWGPVDYAALCLGLYSFLLMICTLLIPRTPRSALVVLALGAVGTCSSFLIWYLPQERIMCNGIVWPVGNVQ